MCWDMFYRSPERERMTDRVNIYLFSFCSSCFLQSPSALLIVMIIRNASLMIENRFDHLYIYMYMEIKYILLLCTILLNYNTVNMSAYSHMSMLKWVINYIAVYILNAICNNSITIKPPCSGLSLVK